MSNNCDKTCTDVVVPTVDNTNRKCTDCGFLDIECVVSESPFPYLGTLPGGDEFDNNLKLIIEKLIEKLQDLQDQIDNL